MNRIRMTSLVFGFLAFFLFSLHASAQFEAPGSLQHTSNTTSTISWVWDDNSDNEQGFTCYSWSWGNVGTNSSGWIRGPKIWEVPADITSYAETGLSTNTQYKRVVVAWKDNGFSREEVPSASWDHITGNYYYGQTYPRSATPTVSPPDYFVGVYTSIQPPTVFSFGPKGMNDLTVRLASLPSNITAGNSGFFIENTVTQGNLSNPVFYDGGLTSWYNPARPITGGSGWWKHNGDYDPLPSLTGTSLETIHWDSYFKNGIASHNSSTGQYTSSHICNYWASENLESNTPYRFRAKARNGDGDETAWCNITDEVWTLPKSPDITSLEPPNICYAIGTRFTFVNNAGWGIGNIDHYRIKWNTSPSDSAGQGDTRWAAGDWIITENNPGHYYLHVRAYNAQGEEAASYEYDGTRKTYPRTYGPFQIGYDMYGKVTISGGTGSYTSVTVYAGGKQTNCDSLGKYKFLHLTPGTYDVYAELSGYRIAVPVTNNGHHSIKLPPDPPTDDNVTRDVDFVLAYRNTYTIAGNVTLIGGPDGRPADVTRINIHRGIANPITVNPDQYGNFYFPGVFAGTYVIWFDIPDEPGYAGYELTSPSGGRYTVSVGPDSTGKDFIFTWQEEEPITISGKVNLLGGSGEVTNASVFCKNLETSIESTAFPNSQGEYSFPNLTPGKDYEVKIKMPGYKVQLPESGVYLLDDVAADTTGIDFTLQPISYFTVTGKVTVSEGIIRAPDVKVKCTGLAEPDLAFSIHPDNDGNYIFSNIPEGSYRISLELPEGYKVTSPEAGIYEPVVLGPNAAGKNFIVESLGTYKISGKVTLKGGTVTPREAMVVCSYYNRAKDEYINYSVMPNSLGFYEFTGLVPAAYSVSVTLRGYITISPSSGKHEIAVAKKDVKDVNFILATFSIFGKVRFNTPMPEPVSNVNLICTATSTNPDVPHVYITIHPDSSGNYAIHNLLPTNMVGNPYRVQAILPGCGVLRPSDGYYDITITNRDEEREFVMGSYTLSGKISIHRGIDDLTKATLICARLNHPEGDELESFFISPKPTGEYLFTSVEPGSYRVRVKMEGYSSLRPKEPEGGENWGYECSVPPSASNLDFILMAKETHNMYTLSGKVTITGGTVTPDRVIIHCGDIRTYPDSAGNYIFKNLNAGTYDVWADRMNYHTTSPVSNNGHYYVVLGESSPEATDRNFTLLPDAVPTYDISGTITLQGGTGNITSARVHCGNLNPVPPNSSGQYSFPNLVPGSYELWVEMDMYITTQPGGTGRQTVRIYDRDISAVDFTLKAIPVYSIEGRVTLPAGDNNYNGVKIFWTGGAAPVQPDPTGLYRIENLLAGTYEVWAEADGYTVVSPPGNRHSVKVGPDEFDRDFELVRYYNISGTVNLNGGTGDVRNAVVYCGNLKAIPDENGDYHFDDLMPGTYSLYTTLKGYTTMTPPNGLLQVVLGPDKDNADFTMDATTLLKVFGKVKILKGGADVTSVLISAGGRSANPLPDSTYTLEGLSPGVYDLTGSLSGYSAVMPASGKYRITLDNKDISGYDFDFTTYSVSGKVRLNGGNADVSTAEVSISGQNYNDTRQPDTSGNYSFDTVPAGEYTVSVSLVNYGVTSPASGSHAVKTGPDAENVDFTLSTYSISGRVSFWGEPGNITEVRVYCDGQDGQRGPLSVNPDGSYAFNHLPAGPYRISVEMDDYTVISPKEGYRDISLYSNTSKVDFILTTYSISGKVTLWQSQDSVTQVTLTLKDSSETVIDTKSPSPDGKYKFRPLSPGSYTVTASLVNHTVITPKDGGGINVVISPNASNINFTLAAYSISGTVKVMDYSGPSGAVVYCQTPTGILPPYPVDNSGKFRFYPLPAGQYRLWVEKNNYDTTSPTGGEYVFDLASWTTKNFTMKKR